MAASPNRLETGTCPLADQVPLELGQRAEDVEDQMLAGGGGVDGVNQCAEARCPHLHIFGGGDELAD